MLYACCRFLCHCQCPSSFPTPTAASFRVPTNWRLLRRVFGPKRDEVRREWRILHNEDLRDLYSSLNIICVINSRIMRWAGHVACKGERGEAYRVLVGKPEGIGRPRRRWEDNIVIDLQDVGRGIDWTDMAQDRDRWRALVNSVMNSRVP